MMCRYCIYYYLKRKKKYGLAISYSPENLSCYTSITRDAHLPIFDINTWHSSSLKPIHPCLLNSSMQNATLLRKNQPVYELSILRGNHLAFSFICLPLLPFMFSRVSNTSWHIINSLFIVSDCRRVASVYFFAWFLWIFLKPCVYYPTMVVHIGGKLEFWQRVNLKKFSAEQSTIFIQQNYSYMFEASLTCVCWNGNYHLLIVPSFRKLVSNVIWAIISKSN